MLQNPMPRGLPLIAASVCLAALLLASGLPLPRASAAALDKEACDALKAEAGQLVQAGVKAGMARGPEWAKANLPAERLAQIARLIEVEQSIAFRCPQPKPPLERAEKEIPVKAEAEVEVKAKPKVLAPAANGTRAAAQAASPQAAPKLKGGVYPADQGAGPAARKSSDGAAEVGVAPKPKPRPKPKTDDAFSPASSGAAGATGLDAQAARQPAAPRTQSNAPAVPAARTTKAPARVVE